MANVTEFESVLTQLRGLAPEERRRAFSQLKRERDEKAKVAQAGTSVLPNSHFSKAHLLERLPNPSNEAYEQKVHIPELTFVGVAKQPDFGSLLLTFYASAWTIELKSLKIYKDAFRGTVVSYERLANVIYDDLMATFEPHRLRMLLTLRPRGGISSCLTIDSDWKIRGGNEQFADWQANTDRFGFEVTNATSI